MLRRSVRLPRCCIQGSAIAVLSLSACGNATATGALPGIDAFDATFDPDSPSATTSEGYPSQAHDVSVPVVAASPTAGTSTTMAALPAGGPDTRQVSSPAATYSPSQNRPSGAGQLDSRVTERQEAWEADEREAVIVDLAVEWRPEHELSDEEVWEQRARIEAAQDEVLSDLGAHGRLSRRLTETAQMALTVDAEGRGILAEHRLVATVHEDRPGGPDSH